MCLFVGPHNNTWNYPQFIDNLFSFPAIWPDTDSDVDVERSELVLLKVRSWSSNISSMSTITHIC